MRHLQQAPAARALGQQLVAVVLVGQRRLALPGGAAGQAPQAGHRDVQRVGQGADARPVRTLDLPQRLGGRGERRGPRHEPAVDQGAPLRHVAGDVERRLVLQLVGQALDGPKAVQPSRQHQVDQLAVGFVRKPRAQRHAFEHAETAHGRGQHGARDGQRILSSAHRSPEIEVRSPPNLLVKRMGRIARSAYRGHRPGSAWQERYRRGYPADRKRFENRPDGHLGSDRGAIMTRDRDAPSSRRGTLHGICASEGPLLHRSRSPGSRDNSGLVRSPRPHLCCIASTQPP